MRHTRLKYESKIGILKFNGFLRFELASSSLSRSESKLVSVQLKFDMGPFQDGDNGST
jgi:hypothetical protein